LDSSFAASPLVHGLNDVPYTIGENGTGGGACGCGANGGDEGGGGDGGGGEGHVSR
jgi:hypothetical protein